MWRKFQRRQVFEALQFTGEDDWSVFAVDLYNGTDRSFILFDCGGMITIPPRHGLVRTLEGSSLVCPGDYIVKDEKGRKFSFKAEQFEKCYQEA